MFVRVFSGSNDFLSEVDVGEVVGGGPVVIDLKFNFMYLFTFFLSLSY